MAKIINRKCQNEPPIHIQTDPNKIFDELIHVIQALRKKKRSDYGEKSGVGNLMECERIGIQPWVGVTIRMGDKMSRIRSAVNNGIRSLSNESVTDSFIDLAVYSLLACAIILAKYSEFYESFRAMYRKELSELDN